MYIEKRLHEPLRWHPDGVGLLAAFAETSDRYQRAVAELGRYATLADLITTATEHRDARKALTRLCEDLRKEHLPPDPAVERPEPPQEGRSEEETTLGMGGEGVGALRGSKWKLSCPDCRCDLTLRVESYPTGPSEPRRCPVCAQDHTKWCNASTETTEETR